MRKKDMVDYSGIASRGPHGHRWHAATTLLCLICCVAPGGDSVDQPKGQATKEYPKRRPLVLMEQSPIRGKVFFLTEEEGELAAAGVRIQVLDKDDKILHDSATDAGGAFTVPALAAAKYQLKAGKLRLELRVESRQNLAESGRTVPKTILIYMPKDLKQ